MAEYIPREAAIDAAKYAWAKGLEPTQYIIAIAEPRWTEGMADGEIQTELYR